MVDVTEEGVFLATAAVCPATDGDDGVTDAVVITGLAVDTTVVVTAGLLLATEL